MSIAEKPSCYSFRIYALPDRVFRTEIGRISSQSKGQIAGGRQGVEKHLFAGRIFLFYILAPTTPGGRSRMEHIPGLQPRGRGIARLAAVLGNRRGRITGARARGLPRRRSPRDARALAR